MKSLFSFRPSVSLQSSGNACRGMFKKCMRSQSGTSAFTLVEVMVSMTLFAFLAAGTVYASLQARSWSEQIVRESIATAVASGFLEQMTAAEFAILMDSVVDRSQPFGFITRDGQALNPPKTLTPMSSTDWGDPIVVPLVDKRDDDGNVIVGPSMNMWLIPAAEAAVDSPNDAIAIRLHFRWQTGRKGGEEVTARRTLIALKTRVAN